MAESPASGRGLVLAVAFTVLLLLASGGRGTYAGWVASRPVPGTTLSSGLLDLAVTGSGSALSFARLVPGASVAGVLTVANQGDVPLAYRVDATGTNPDAKGLAAALVAKVTGAATVTGAAPSATCAGAALPGAGTSVGPGLLGSGSPRVLAAGASETLCVQLSLPASAPASLQSASTAVTLTFTARSRSGPGNGWTDTVDVTGASLQTVTPTAPVVSCGLLQLLAATLEWTAVPGATGYRLFYGPGGSSTTDVGAGTTSRTFTGVTSGTFSVRTIYGSTTWLSGSSNTRTYSITLGLIATCG